METRRFALITGSIYIVLAIFGCIPALLSAPSSHAPYLSFAVLYGYLFGLFPVNILLNYIHFSFGFWGCAAYNDFVTARLYAKVLTVFYGVLAILGLFPILNTTFGFIPLFGINILLHGATALIAAYFGFIKPVTAADINSQSVQV